MRDVSFGKKKIKCVSNFMTSSHNESFVLLFKCMFTTFIHLINKKHLECLNGIRVYLYTYMSAWMFILLVIYSFSIRSFFFYYCKWKRSISINSIFCSISICNVVILVHQTFQRWEEWLSIACMISIERICLLHFFSSYTTSIHSVVYV